MKHHTPFAIGRRALLVAAPIFFGIAKAQTKKTERAARPPNAAEVAWLANASDVGLRVLAFYANTSEVTPRNLDAAFTSWKSDRSSRRAPDQVVAEGLGTVFGNLVVKHKQADWAVVTDSFGTELAVRSSTGKELYPISSVWKRIDPKDGDINLFEPMWTLIADKELVDRR
ncbi:DUF3806 domain-containing protein [Variovorax ureilyticus]|uniref:DUF3806 domain-containing protein n=1 Tax=Variovorax ureilyticus TaxID=1836198 RepID=UPI003D678297